MSIGGAAGHFCLTYHYAAMTVLFIPDDEIEVRIENSNYQKVVPRKEMGMSVNRFRRTLVVATLAAGLAAPAVRQIPVTPKEEAFPEPAYSPYAGRDYPMRPYFGDTHLHTSYSMTPAPRARAWVLSTRIGSRGATR